MNARAFVVLVTAAAGSEPLRRMLDAVGARVEYVEASASTYQETVQNRRANLLVDSDGAGGFVAATAEGGTIGFPNGRHLWLLGIFICRRAKTKWFATEADPSLTQCANEESRAKAGELLRFAHDARLLCDRNGNIAVRTREPGSARFLISPRAVNKADLRASDLLPVRVDSENRRVFCPSIERKSSIDTGVLGTLFGRLPRCDFFLHFHPTPALVLPDAVTGFPYPCGTLEEAEELSAVIDSGVADGFLVEMIHHGYLLGGSEERMRAVVSEWNELLVEHTAHLEEIGEPGVLDRSSRYPIFSGPRVDGLYLLHEEGWGSIYVKPVHRGRKLGAALAAAVASRGTVIAVHDGCRVSAFYRRLGWRLKERRGSIEYFDPPAALR